MEYLLKVNLAIILFYGVYHVFFRQDTLFQWKRILLLGLLAVAYLYPLEHRHIIAESVVIPVYTLPEIVVTNAPAPETSTFSVWQWVQLIYLAGIAILSLRLLIQFGVLIYKISQTKRRELFGITIHESTGLQTPFSFFGWIVLDPTHYTENELKEILLHETTHVRQFHSIDTLLAEIVCIVCWFNPFAWWLKKEIQMNLEFLADRSVINSGCEAEHYQFHLLRLTYHKSITNFTNNFNFSPLKTRIIMMTKKQTSRASLLRYGLLVPAIAALFIFNSSLQSSAQTVVEKVVPQAKEKVAEVKKEKITEVPGTRTKVVQNGKVVEVAQVTAKPTKVYDHVEKMPSFPGGNQELYKFLADNLIYPKEAQEKKIEGRVIVRFTVEADGSIANVETIRSLDPLCDAEAIRVVQKMPKWIPGEQSGKVAAVRYVLPMIFKLQGAEPKKEDTETHSVTVSTETATFQTHPLIVIDGVTMSSSFDLKTIEDNIYSIDVLKNESTRLYGEKGKNGVILITTKAAALKEKQ
ncbi:cell envelope biogenesis protein TonB [Bacteroidia bacterium]|nr:cell envelope biogenesis protein TonB [Bacteroidia bacterium]